MSGGSLHRRVRDDARWSLVPRGNEALVAGVGGRASADLARALACSGLPNRTSGLSRSPAPADGVLAGSPCAVRIGLQCVRPRSGVQLSGSRVGSRGTATRAPLADVDHDVRRIAVPRVVDHGESHGVRAGCGERVDGDRLRRVVQSVRVEIPLVGDHAPAAIR